MQTNLEIENLNSLAYRSIQSRLRLYKLQGKTKIKLNLDRKTLLFELQRIEIQAKNPEIKQIGLSLLLKVLRTVDCIEQGLTYKYSEEVERKFTLEEHGFKCEWDGGEDYWGNWIITFSDEFKYIHKMMLETLKQVDYTEIAPYEYWYDEDFEGYVEPIVITIQKLHNYGLIHWDFDYVEPASGQEVMKWVSQREEWLNGKGNLDHWTKEDYRYYSEWEEIALRQNRLDILRVFGYGEKAPIDRRAYWVEEYQNSLATSYAKPWEWANPEKHEVCPELTDYYQLPKPPSGVKIVLSVLHLNENPFYIKKPDPNVLTIGKAGGKFKYWKKENRESTLNDFTQWHNESLDILGEERLAAIYKRVFGSDWGVIEEILNGEGEWWRVLRVSPTAPHETVKKAYKTLCKQWHPDLNQSPEAHTNMQKINEAFDNYELDCRKCLFTV